MSEFVLQKRRSGRQVKRRKYNEDLDFKVVDDDGETIAVLGAGRTSALSASTLAWQAEVWPLHDLTHLTFVLWHELDHLNFLLHLE